MLGVSQKRETPLFYFLTPKHITYQPQKGETSQPMAKP